MKKKSTKIVVWTDTDEWWPDYTLYTQEEKDAGAYTHDGPFEIPESLYRAFNKAKEKYEELSEKIDEIVDPPENG